MALFSAPLGSFLENGYRVESGPPLNANASGTITAGRTLNQVQRAYNGLGQLVTEYQAHGGLVNTCLGRIQGRS